MVTDEEAKAIQEVAKATQETIPVVHDFGRFVGRIVGGSLEQAAGIVEDRLRYVRWERQMRLQRRAEQFMSDIGMDQPTRYLPLNVAIPLLQSATLEEDDDLQDVWARLLVNAIDADSGVEVRRSFVTILQDFGALEARLLDAIVHAPKADYAEVRTEKLPDAYVDLPEGEPAADPPTPIKLALWNLVRLGCVSPSMTWSGLRISMVVPTDLGRALVDACTIEAKND